MKTILSCLGLAFCSMVMDAQIVAFPGAEGFGALATGGRDSRKVVHVTNLNASGPGSFAEAVSGSNRIVVFDVGGVIRLSPSDMVAIDRHDNITVLGQTAPGQGITVYGNRVLIRNCKNIIFRYIRMRGGINMEKDAETLTMDGAENVILDHCSISWGRWDNVHIKNANNITWQYCIISEGIDPQRFGAITDGTRNWTISHCLWIDNHSRNPKMKCWAQMINSVVYNGGNGVVGGHSSADNYQDLINNYYIAGPQGSSKYSQWTETDHLYQRGNLLDDNLDGVLNGTVYTNTSCTNELAPHFSPTVAVTIDTPEDAYRKVVDEAGCSRVRDSHDARLIRQLQSLGKEGAIIDKESDVGGIGTLEGGTPALDSDGDGIPDEWETANGLNPKDAADATQTASDGYLWIEKYAESRARKVAMLLAPTGVKVTNLAGDRTKVGLSWTNVDDKATAVLIEMSTDGEHFTQVDSLSAKASFKSFSGLEAETMYYFRLRSTDGTDYSAYSEVVRINEPEGAKAGGGTAAGTKVFIPQEGKLYRIICYTSRYYNKGANFTGAAQYLTVKDHRLTATTAFDWKDPSLLWTITRDARDTTQYYLQHYAGKEYLQPTVDGEGYAFTAVDASPLEMTYVGDQTTTQADAQVALSFFRINAPENKGYQLRGRSADNWLWGNGTITRADMAFTFQPVSKSVFGTTAITKIQTRKPVGKEIYNVHGMRLNGLQKGLNIVRFADGTTRKMIIR